MNIILWIAQTLLALMFFMTGIMKVTQPYEKLAKQMGYVNDFAPNIIRGIGLLETLGAAGVVLPALFGFWPWLTPLAAMGLVLTMLGASFTHLRRKEYSMIAVNLVLLSLGAFVAYGRFAAQIDL